MVGSRPVHHDLEAALAEWRGTEAALVLPTGFAANLAALTTFGDRRTRIVSDELNHASIVDGCRLARAEVAVYPHGDTDRLAAELDRAERDGVDRTIVVTDTVFSMDGDVAPLEAILDCCRAHGSLADRRRGPRRARAIARSTTTPTASRSSAWARCRRHSGRSADSSPAAPATSTSS